jgi:hypothetical protein
MSAGVTSNALAIEFLVEITLTNARIDDVAKGRHTDCLYVFYRRSRPTLFGIYRFSERIRG